MPAPITATSASPHRSAPDTQGQIRPATATAVRSSSSCRCAYPVRRVLHVHRRNQRVSWTGGRSAPVLVDGLLVAQCWLGPDGAGARARWPCGTDSTKTQRARPSRRITSTKASACPFGTDHSTTTRTGPASEPGPIALRWLGPVPHRGHQGRQASRPVRLGLFGGRRDGAARLASASLEQADREMDEHPHSVPSRD
jgi:hypothetical protein